MGLKIEDSVITMLAMNLAGKIADLDYKMYNVPRSVKRHFFDLQTLGKFITEL